MKRHILRGFLALLIIGLVVGSSATIAAERGGRLVIWRVATLGNDLFLGVDIDGRHAVGLPYGHHLDTFLAPGRHVVSVQPYPKIYPDAGAMIVINVRPGELYNLTVKGSVRQLYFSRS